MIRCWTVWNAVVRPVRRAVRRAVHPYPVGRGHRTVRRAASAVVVPTVVCVTVAGASAPIWWPRSSTMSPPPSYPGYGYGHDVGFPDATVVRVDEGGSSLLAVAVAVAVFVVVRSWKKI